MTTKFVTEYLDKKIEENEDYIVCTFYDLRIKNNLSEEQVQEFLELAKTRLENLQYQVYFTGAKFDYKSNRNIVENNQYMVAIREKGC